MPHASSRAAKNYWQREKTISRPLSLRLTDTAEDDLAEIWADIAQKASVEIASRFVAEIEAAFEPVRHFPMAAPSRAQLGMGLRVTFHSPYAIYYRPTADAIVIVRVLHGARDVAAIAEQGGFA